MYNKLESKKKGEEGVGQEERRSRGGRRGGGGGINEVIYDCVFLLDGGARREQLGLPTNWNRVYNFCFFKGSPFHVEEIVTKGKGLKHPEIPKLEDYHRIPSRVWDLFPKQDLPISTETEVNTRALANYLKSRSPFLRNCEVRRGWRAVAYLTTGAPACQDKVLPPLSCKNADSVYENGQQMTDTLVEWLKEGYVAGPFSQPPLEKFRVNALMAVLRGDKVRPVLNVSSPKGMSLNDNVKVSAMERVFMSSPKKFGRSVLEAGKGARMTKFDMCNAYKIVPCRTEDLRLQGFEWGGKLFVETRLIFGARTSVSNYDTVGNTVLSLAMAGLDIPRRPCT